jgi:hypothetical protein
MIKDQQLYKIFLSFFLFVPQFDAAALKKGNDYYPATWSLRVFPARNFGMRAAGIFNGAPV